MVAAEPEKGITDEKALDLFTTIVEDVAVPLRMIALARVGMLVQMCSVEESQAMLIGGEVRWHPVENHADAALVQRIDEVHQILRRTIVAGRSEVAGGLIAPGAEKRVIHDRQKLHMRVSQLFKIIRQLRRQLAIGKRAIILFGHPSPGTHVHFVNRHGLIESVVLTTRRHPFSVAPLVIEIPHDGSCLWRYLIEN